MASILKSPIIPSLGPIKKKEIVRDGQQVAAIMVSLLCLVKVYYNAILLAKVIKRRVWTLPLPLYTDGIPASIRIDSTIENRT